VYNVLVSVSVNIQMDLRVERFKDCIGVMSLFWRRNIIYWNSLTAFAHSPRSAVPAPGLRRRHCSENKEAFCRSRLFSCCWSENQKTP